MTLIFPESQNASWLNYEEKELITYSNVSGEQFQNSEMEVNSILCQHDIQGSVNFFLSTSGTSVIGINDNIFLLIMH